MKLGENHSTLRVPTPPQLDLQPCSSFLSSPSLTAPTTTWLRLKDCCEKYPIEIESCNYKIKLKIFSIAKKTKKNVFKESGSPPEFVFRIERLWPMCGSCVLILI